MPQFVIEREMPGVGKLGAGDLKGASQTSCSVLRDMGPGKGPGAKNRNWLLTASDRKNRNRLLTALGPRLISNPISALEKRTDTPEGLQ